MKRVLILVEGQTEERFVKRVLGPHLEGLGIFATPKIVVTKRAKSGHQFQGGVNAYRQVRADLIRLLGDSDVAAVSTMFDYYGLPEDFPGCASIPLSVVAATARAAHIETALAADLDDRRLVPYISLHEFEALLFSDPDAFEAYFPGSNGRARVAAIRAAVASPEEINDGKTTHPAARLLSLFRDYDKVTVGAVMAGRIGLQKMRDQCPHFDRWVSQLESL